MPVNKVVYGVNTLIDITDTTATVSDVALGKIFYGADGSKKTGTSSSSGSISVTDEANATGITCVIVTSSTPPTPVETWETIWDSITSFFRDNNNDYPYCWISDLASVEISVGSVWRITYDGVQYRCTAKQDGSYAIIGNPKYSGGTDDGSDVPMVFSNQGWGAWTGGIDLPNADANVYIKIERLTSA